MTKFDINEIDGEVKERSLLGDKLPMAIIITLGVFALLYFGGHFVMWLLA